MVKFHVVCTHTHEWSFGKCFRARVLESEANPNNNMTMRQADLSYSMLKTNHIFTSGMPAPTTTSDWETGLSLEKILLQQLWSCSMPSSGRYTFEILLQQLWSCSMPLSGRRMWLTLVGQISPLKQMLLGQQPFPTSTSESFLKLEAKYLLHFIRFANMETSWALHVGDVQVSKVFWES